MNSATSYEYPKPPNCNSIILAVKLLGLFNLNPTSPDWYQGISGRDGRLRIHSRRQLKPEEKRKLDAFMADPASGIYPEKPEGTVFIIEDLVDAWKKIENEVGVKIRWIFANVPDHTKLEVWFDRELSPAEKKKFLSAYSALASEKR